MNAERHSTITGRVTDESGRAVPDAVSGCKQPRDGSGASRFARMPMGDSTIDADFRASFVTASAEDGNLLASGMEFAEQSWAERAA